MVHKYTVTTLQYQSASPHRIGIMDESGLVAYIDMSTYGHISGWVSANALVYQDVFASILPMLHNLMEHFNEWEAILEE